MLQHRLWNSTPSIFNKKTIHKKYTSIHKTHVLPIVPTMICLGS